MTFTIKTYECEKVNANKLVINLKRLTNCSVHVHKALQWSIQ